jgi:hypothetical protein
MGLLIASASVIITISVFNRILKMRNRSLRNGNREMNEQSQPVGVTETVYMYIIATLLGQGKTPLAILTYKQSSQSNNDSMTGGYISCKITSVRIVIGAWCLLTLVLINAYNGVLISYVTTTHQTQPLINSIEDVATKSNIQIVVNKGQGPDTVILSV